METQKKEITVAATLENLDKVVCLVEDMLSITSCPAKVKMQIALCLEEVFVNVASYAYDGEEGSCTIAVSTQYTDTDGMITLEITDDGRPFNPLEKEDPDISLSADDRQVGGLGIYMVKNYMDYKTYHYKNKKNMLRLDKSWHI